MTEQPKENLYQASEMKKVFQSAEMALWLDGYDDIFSDFDHRPYSQRMISDDFLLEAMKAARDRGKDNYELKFLLAPEARNYPHEQVIKERLHHYFGTKYHQLVKDRKGIIRNGLLMILCGVCLMFVASIVATLYLDKNLLLNFVVALTEPAGWFLSWEGMSRAVYSSNKRKSEISFYNKMAKSKISFISY